MHVSAVRPHLRLEALEIVIEVCERVLFDLARGRAQLLEFGERVDRGAALVNKPAFGAS